MSDIGHKIFFHIAVIINLFLHTVWSLQITITVDFSGIFARETSEFFLLDWWLFNSLSLNPDAEIQLSGNTVSADVKSPRYVP